MEKQLLFVFKPTQWLSSGNFFRGGKIYCYANFFCYAIVFGPNLKEGQKFLGGKLPQGEVPPAPPCRRKPDTFGLIKAIMPCVEENTSDCHPQQPPLSKTRVYLKLITRSLSTRDKIFIESHVDSITITYHE